MNMRKNIQKYFIKEEGYVLLWLSIFLIIAGLGVAAYTQGIAVEREQKLKKRTETSMFTIANNFSDHISEIGYYPCPARRDLAPDDPDYGVETDCTDETTVAAGNCGDGYCVTQNYGNRIRIGIVPFKTLGIEIEDALDAHGNFITYAISERVARTGAAPLGPISEKIGDIIIETIDVDGNSTETNNNPPPNPTPNPLFALVSHGPDGRGAFRKNGNPNLNACSGVQADIENCDNDFRFLKRPYSESNGPAHFDDVVETRLEDLIYIWAPTYQDGAKSSHYITQGNIGVGPFDVDNGQEPQELFHVGPTDSDNMRISGFAGPGNTDPYYLQTSQVCDKAGNCFDPELLVGDTGDLICDTSLVGNDDFNSNTLKDSDSRALLHIENSRATCTSLTLPVAGRVECPQDFFVSNVALSGSEITLTCRDHFRRRPDQILTVNRNDG